MARLFRVILPVSDIAAGLAGGGGAEGPCIIATTGGGASWRTVAAAASAVSLRPALTTYRATLDSMLQGMWQGGAQCAAADERLAQDGTGWLYLDCDPLNPGALLVRTAALSGSSHGASTPA